MRGLLSELEGSTNSLGDSSRYSTSYTSHKSLHAQSVLAYCKWDMYILRSQPRHHVFKIAISVFGNTASRASAELQILFCVLPSLVCVLPSLAGVFFYFSMFSEI